MREAKSALRLLLKLQEARRKLEADHAACDRLAWTEHAAIGLMAEDRRDVGLLAVTSADRLNAGWTAACRARERGLVHARCHIERLFAGLPRHCGIVSVLDGHPATLA